MKILRLYIDNFLCYDKSLIDFTTFNAALVLGKKENNDMFANGVGKTTIFKAIEYALFNQSDVNFEELIRDDTNMCKVILDFAEGEHEYRISRSRTLKGASDVTILRRNLIPGEFNEVYFDSLSPITNNKYWVDLSGRRSADTEKEIVKLIKFNINSFRNTVHFVQKDTNGLATATPEKRKAILKDALSLAMYQKMEKIAKEKASLINKEVEKQQILLNNIGDPLVRIDQINKDLANSNTEYQDKDIISSGINVQIADLTALLEKENEHYSLISGAYENLISKQKSIKDNIKKTENTLSDLKLKKSSIAKVAKANIEDIKSLKDNLNKLISLDFTKIDELNELISVKKQELAKNSLIIQNNKDKHSELIIPMPKEAVCRHCRQPLSDEHRKVCQDQINKEINECVGNIASAKNNSLKLNDEIASCNKEVVSLVQSKKKVDEFTNLISMKNAEINEKNIRYNEYISTINQLEKELCELVDAQLVIEKDIANSGIEEINLCKNKILDLKSKIANSNLEKANITNNLNAISNKIAVLKYSLKTELSNLDKKTQLNKDILELSNKSRVFDPILKAFSSTGIPNIIIQNILDDLQFEANTILNKLKPGMQMSFVVEKTKTDGSQDDTLDIVYFVNGKKRSFKALSGAMQMTVHFSLKLGLSFLLQKIMGTNIEFLLFDEIDPDLDKATVDTFADIVKLFQKDFTILVITHNDRLKDKFSHAILVEQDINMVSNAKVVNSW